jgi:hypothetical protein
MRESSQTKVPRSLTWTLVTTKFTVILLLPKKTWAGTQSGIERLSIPATHCRIVAHPLAARLFHLHVLSFGRCGSLVTALFQLAGTKLGLHFVAALA